MNKSNKMGLRLIRAANEAELERYAGSLKVYLGFDDIRHTAGFLADLGPLIIEAIQKGWTKDWYFANGKDFRDYITTCFHICRDFSKGSKTFLKGAKRPGCRELFQRAMKARDRMQEFWNKQPLGDNTSIQLLADLALQVVIVGMLPRPLETYIPYPGGITSLEETKIELSHLKIDGTQIQRIELDWRFKDASHGRRCEDVRNAFDAAWLAGAHDFARQLVGSGNGKK